MAYTTHSARITGPVSYVARSGEQARIPLGPCLVEQVDGHLVDIIWGKQGEQSVALPVKDLEAAEDCGNLVVLD